MAKLIGTVGDGKITLVKTASKNGLPLVMKGGKTEYSRNPPQDKPSFALLHLVSSQLARVFFITICFISSLA